MFLVFSASGCSQDDDQRDFEQEAFSLPEGFTETDGSGRIISEDPDDWRISPNYSGIVTVDPPFPNPVQVSDIIQIHINPFQSAVFGLSVIVVIEGGTNLEFRPVYTDHRSPLPPGLSVMEVNPVHLGRFNTIESARGLHRLVLLDGRDNVISYGDVMVE